MQCITKNVGMTKIQHTERGILLVFVAFCLFTIREWAPLSDRALRFL